MRGIIGWAALFFVASCVQTDRMNTDCSVDYPARKTQEMIDIENGMSVYRFVVENKVSAEEATSEQREAIGRLESILADRARPVDEIDLAIVKAALSILSTPDVWNRNDTRECARSAMKVSLYCALHDASLEVAGVYEHRRTVMQETRFAVEAASEGKEYDHRLMGYNNDPDTDFEDIRSILFKTKDTIEKRLDLQARCEL